MPISYSKEETDVGIFIKISAPESLSYSDFPEQTIQFYNLAENFLANDSNIIYDLSNVDSIDPASIGILISQLKSPNINNGRICQVEFPKNDIPKRALKTWTIFKAVKDTYRNDIKDNNQSINKVSSIKVGNVIAKNICTYISNYLYGEVIKLKPLYEILIECMANTNDHASVGSSFQYEWWLFTHINESSGTISLIFLDLGVGVFKSLPVKQHITENNYNTFNIPIVTKIQKNERSKESNKVFNALISGDICSRTGKKERGKGIPLIERHSKNKIFSDFKIISNDVYIDLKTNNISNMSENFSGTVIVLELKKEGYDD